MKRIKEVIVSFFSAIGDVLGDIIEAVVEADWDSGDSDCGCDGGDD